MELSNSVEKMREEMMKEIGQQYGISEIDMDEMLARDYMIQVVGRFESEADIPKHMRLTAIRQFNGLSYFVAGQNLDSIIPYSQMLFSSKEEELYYKQLKKRFRLAQIYEDKDLRHEVMSQIENLETKEVANGGIWTHYRDFSGSFEVDGKEIAQYDMVAREIKLNGKGNSFGYDFGGIEFVKDYVQRQLEYQQAQSTVQKGKDVLFTYKIHGYTAYYNMGDITLEELKSIYEQTEKPFVDMPGQKIYDIGEFAWLEQSDLVRLSVTADVDNNQWTVYEINGIPETERTDYNVSFNTCELNSNVKQELPSEVLDSTPALDSLAEKLLEKAQTVATVPKLGI